MVEMLLARILLVTAVFNCNMVANTDIQLAANSIIPDVAASDILSLMTDVNDTTCVAFEAGVASPWYTIVTIPFVRDPGNYIIQLKGYNLGCNSVTSVLYMTPLTGTLSENPQGKKLKYCSFLDASVDEGGGGLETCTFSCLCTNNCTELRLVHMGLSRSVASRSWTLCSMVGAPCPVAGMLYSKDLGHCYYFEVTNPRTFEEAMAFCADLYPGAYLTDILSQEEQDAIES